MAERNNKTKVGLCPVCVGIGPLTKDHVPARGLFLKPRPKNTITVLTCETCNQGSKLDDEYFRLYITANAEPGSNLHRLWNEKVVNSTLDRSPALRVALLDGMDAIRKHHRIEPLTTFDGHVLTNEEVERVLPLEQDRINRVVEKIIRCLHYHHEGTPLPKAARLSVSVEPLTENEIEILVKQRTGLVGGDLGEFIYRYVGGGERNSWRWVLLFYLRHHFRVSVQC